MEAISLRRVASEGGGREGREKRENGRQPLGFHSTNVLFISVCPICV